MSLSIMLSNGFSRHGISYECHLVVYVFVILIPNPIILYVYFSIRYI